jgi:hypothetical protein
MAALDNGFKIGTPLLIGVGALVLAPLIIPVVGPVVKLLVKATIKGGFVFIQKGRELISEAAETLEDITAEVKAELIAERGGPADGAQPDQSAGT